MTFLSDLGPREWSQRLGNGRGMPGGRFSRPGDHSGPISGHFRRFRARPPICDLNIVILGQLRLLRCQQCDIGNVEISETSTLCVETRQMSALATEDMSAVETGPMSAAETGQMSAVETRQMPPAETKQM